MTGVGRSSIEWVLRGAFLEQRSEAEQSEVPTGLMLVDANEDGMYTQRYFDSRGTFGLWKAPEPVVPVWELRMITRLRRGC